MQPIKWSKQEIRTLRMLAKQGLSSTDASYALVDRSPGAVRFKAQAVGIRFHSLGRAHSRSQKTRWQ